MQHVHHVAEQANDDLTDRDTSYIKKDIQHCRNEKFISQPTLVQDLLLEYSLLVRSSIEINSSAIFTVEDSAFLASI